MTTIVTVTVVTLLLAGVVFLGVRNLRVKAGYERAVQQALIGQRPQTVNQLYRLILGNKNRVPKSELRFLLAEMEACGVLTSSIHSGRQHYALNREIKA